MTKYILTSAAALALIIAPIAAIAQEAGGSGNTGKMKGPPNADGYQKKSDQGAGDKKDNNGAAAAKATGEDKK